MKAAIKYLEGLEQNNNREWFHANKKEYDAVRKDFLAFTQNLISELSLVDPRLSDLKANDCVFRIFRDIRFSKDKTPYKTHFSAFIAKGGRKTLEGGYYVQLGPSESFLGAGVYSPEKDVLKAIRQEILYTPEEFMHLCDDATKLGYEMMEDDKLKKGPKDFPSDSPHIDLIKYKHYIFSRKINPKDFLNDSPAKHIAKLFTPLVPFNNYLNRAVEFKGNM